MLRWLRQQRYWAIGLALVAPWVIMSGPTATAAAGPNSGSGWIQYPLPPGVTIQHPTALHVNGQSTAKGCAWHLMLPEGTIAAERAYNPRTCEVLYEVAAGTRSAAAPGHSMVRPDGTASAYAESDWWIDGPVSEETSVDRVDANWGFDGTYVTSLTPSYTTNDLTGCATRSAYGPNNGGTGGTTSYVNDYVQWSFPSGCPYFGSSWTVDDWPVQLNVTGNGGYTCSFNPGTNNGYAYELHNCG